MIYHFQPIPAYFQYKKSATIPPKEIRSSKMPASVQMKDHLLNCLSLLPMPAYFQYKTSTPKEI